VKTYEERFEEFMAWRTENGLGNHLPSPDVQVATFVEGVAIRRGPGVAGAYLAAISKVHVLRGAGLQRSQLLKGMAKAYDKQQKRRSNPEKTDSISPSAVVALWEEWRSGRCPVQLRAKVLAFIAGAGLGLRADKRAAELIKLDMRDVREMANGQFMVTFRDIKNMPEGMVVPIEPVRNGGFCPCAMLRRQQQARQKDGAQLSDPFFVTVTGKRTRSGFWTEAVRAAVDAAVRKGTMSKAGKWSSRSLRVGGATALQRLGYGELEARALGGWTSKAMGHYLRRQALADKNLSTEMFALKN
jgi:hypothetical protein